MELNEQINESINSATDVEVQNVEAEAQPQEQAQELWQSDKRYGSMWNSADDLYNSYKHLEKEYQPYTQLAKKHGLSNLDDLEQTLDKYKEYSDPNSDINLVYENVKGLFEHEKYGPEVDKFFNELSRKIEYDKYGAILPPEVKEKLAQVDKLQAKEQEREEKNFVAEQKVSIQKNIDRIEEFCGKNGINGFEAEKFLEHCIENKVPIANLYSYFLEDNLDDILSQNREMTAAQALEQSSKNSKGVINNSHKDIPPSNSIPKDYDELGKTLEKMIQ